MIDRIAAVIVDEGKWLPASMGLAVSAVAFVFYRQSRADLPTRRRILAAMNLFVGVTLVTMAFGHFVAVSTKFALGTLRGSILVLYPIGIALAIPSWLLARHGRELLLSPADRGRPTVVLNAWLAATLLVLGIVNLPLAVPPLLNIAYSLQSRRTAGWVIAGLASAVIVALFVGALIFMASGQTFEQFSGIE